MTPAALPPLADPDPLPGVTPVTAELALQLQAEILGRAHFAEAANALAQQLCLRLQCDRASVGWLGPHGMTVVAASYMAELHTRQETARLVSAAMDEAVEQGVSLVHPAPANEAPRIRLAHEELAHRQGYALCTLPLVQQGRIVGALLLERRSGPFDATETAAYEHLACVLAPTLALHHAAELSLWTQLREAIRQRIQPATPEARAARRPLLWMAGGVAGLILVILLFPFTYRVSAPARLEGAVQRVLTSPTDGFLSRVHVRPGDRVRRGQVLAELADQDMLVEQRGLQAELAVSENELASAQASGNRAEYGLSQSRMMAAQAKLDLIQQNLSRAQLRAPFDGVVIEGDLTQAIGAPMERGTRLITLAPDTGYRVMIEADERDVADLKPGQTGSLALAALPARRLPVKVERVTALATTESGRHYFAVYATLPGESAALRPGMQGVVKIDIDRRSMLLNGLARSYHWLRYTLWSWGL